MASRSGTPRKKAAQADKASTGTPSRRKGANNTATAAKNSSGDALNPSLPRPPPSLSSISSGLDQLSLGNTASGTKGKQRRKKRSSVDERDPSTANSTEDEDEGDTRDLSVFGSSKTLAGSIAPSRIRARSAGPQDEKQNICVCVRIRPSAPGAAEEDAPIWKLDPELGRIRITEHHPIMEKRKNGVVSEELYDYHFDSLLLPPNPTENLYTERISPIVKAAMEGYNATVFSYGQTGSGKTHTMMGSDEEPGIIPQAVQEVFSYIRSEPEREFLLRMSYLESYNETLRDLLSPNSTSADLRIHEDKNGRIVVNGLKEEIVSSPTAVVDCILKGEKNRSVAGTDWNLRSSRSHCVVSMIIESRPRSSAFSADTITPSNTTADLSLPPAGVTEVRISQLNLIDLAGSEKATSQEERRKEGAFINKSLLSLGIVIAKLAEGKEGTAHIPYRDSKLTRLLQTSLSGNARIAIICTISPEGRHGVESINTLKFAQRASKVVTKAERGVILGESGALIAKYEKELDELRAKLQLNNGSDKLAGAEIDLEDERSKRQKAETEAEDYRLEVMRLREQIGHLSSQIVNSSSAAVSTSYTTGTEETDDDEVGPGRPQTRERGGGKRRISGIAFGLGTPLKKLPGPTNSVRSFSSNLETVKSPSIGNLSRVNALEKQLEDLQREKDADSTTSTARLEQLQDRIKELQDQLVQLQQRMDDAVREKDTYLQEAGTQAETIMRLQKELEALRKHNEKHQHSLESQIAALQAEVMTAKETLAATTSKLQERTQTSETELEAVRAELSSARDEEKSKDIKIKDLEQRLLSSSSASEIQVTELKSVLQDAQNEIVGLSRVKTDLEEREKDVDMLRIDLKSAKQQAEDKDALLQKLEQQLHDSGATRDVQVSTLSKDLEAAQTRITDLSKANEEKHILIKDLEVRITSSAAALDTQVTRLRDELQVARTDVDKLSASKRDLDMENSMLKGVIADQKTVLKEQEEEIENLTTENGTVLSESENRIVAMQKEMERMQREHDEELCKLQHASQSTIAGLSSEVEKMKSTLQSQNETIREQRAELDKKEIARSQRAALIKASTAPPNFSALQAKIHAASSRSGITTSIASRSLSSSAGSNSSAGDSELESKHSLTVASLEKQLEDTKTQLDTLTRKDIDAQDLIAQLRSRIVELEQAIAKFREHVLNQGKLIQELQGRATSESPEPPRIVQSPRRGVILSDNPPTPTTTSTNLPRSPFGNLNHYKSSSINLPSRQSTPVKHGFGASEKPPPLPTPENWASSPKLRRITREHELDLLRERQAAERAKTVLLSPRSERQREWANHQQHGRSRTISTLAELESPPVSLRAKKGSTDSTVLSR